MAVPVSPQPGRRLPYARGLTGDHRGKSRDHATTHILLLRRYKPSSHIPAPGPFSGRGRGRGQAVRLAAGWNRRSVFTHTKGLRDAPGPAAACLAVVAGSDAVEPRIV